MKSIKSIKLNKASRERICQSMLDECRANLLKNAGYESDEAIHDRKEAVLRDVLVGFWNSKYGQYADALKQIPEYLRSGSVFTVDAPTKSYRHLRDPNMPGKKSSGYDVVLTDAEYDEAFAEVIAIENLLEKINQEVNSFKTEIMAVLESVNTTKQLVDLWPSAEQYLPAEIADPQVGINLPALPISRLEARLRGLG